MELKKLIGALALTALVGCASAPQNEAEKKVQNTIDNLPDWYVELPVDEDNKSLYVAGVGLSGDLMLAKDKAILDVEKQLANKIHAKVSSRAKQYIREVGAAGTPLTIEDTEFVTKKLVTEANVAGYINKEMEVFREGQYYRVYLLAEYPVEVNTLRAIAQTERLINKFKGDKDKAFKELDSEINANRESNGDVGTNYSQHDPNAIQERVIVDNGVEIYPYNQ